ncbi:MAG: carbon monoxide dehydrogenase, partial [Dehalococcoidia bacterium]|nr:carbon monoxide dehydrogenase [Dehalococcoidia bacterium]
MGNGKSIDPAALEMLEKAEKDGISTAFSRVDRLKPCPIGRHGSCCSVCFMGPCRMTGKDPNETGVCGATPSTITARNFARAVAAGAAAHSDHGRDMALVLRAVAKGEAKGYQINDTKKLNAVAGYMGIPVDGRAKEEIALDVANKAIEQWGQQEGELICLSRAPKKRQELWKKLGIGPRGIDREIVETLHRTHEGTDQDHEHLLTHALRTSMGDGWGG